MDQKEDDGNANIDGNKVHEADDELIAPHLQEGHPFVQYDGGYKQYNT